MGSLIYTFLAIYLVLLLALAIRPFNRLFSNLIYKNTISLKKILFYGVNYHKNLLFFKKIGVNKYYIIIKVQTLRLMRFMFNGNLVMNFKNISNIINL